jgi:hypothetical protein
MGDVENRAIAEMVMPPQFVKPQNLHSQEARSGGCGLRASPAIMKDRSTYLAADPSTARYDWFGV